jgi:hypothetical protein
MLFHVLALGFAVYTAFEQSSFEAGILVWLILLAVRIVPRILHAPLASKAAGE